VLHLDDVRKTYHAGTFTQSALDGVTITFRDNEFVAILGPSGSGKTTLLNIVGGLDHADSGDLVIDQVSTSEYKDRDWDAYRNNRIGFVFQSYNLIPHQTVLANVELALTLSGVEPAERKRRARQALDQVGLSDHVNKLPNQLSGGQMQRVAIARALVNDPEIVLADEPTGALDSTTGTQVMGLLEDIAEDRLVIMVTHNPDLAEEYATRIVSLKDGQIVDDSDPFEAGNDLREAKPARRTSMSFLTAISLSFRNLLTKKGRTLMTSFAGSIGIVGIATILALANGVNAYIRNVEENTLSLYPLTISTQAIDLTSLMLGAKDTSTSSSTASWPSGQAHEIPELTRMFSHIGTNDLASLKTFLDSPKSGITPYVNSVEYDYNVMPQIYAADTSQGVRQVNPNKVFSPLGAGSSDTSAFSSSFAMGMTANVFWPLPKETGLVHNQYILEAGRWPKAPTECVLVLTSSGGVSDFDLYAMGLRDPEELNKMVEALANGWPVPVPADTNRTYSYQQLMGVQFKVVPATAYYQYDPTYGVWTDKSGDETWMKSAIAAGEPLSIVGILKPDPSATATMLNPGLYYSADLIPHLMAQAAKSTIVRQQLAVPDVNVFSGKLFSDDSSNLSDFDFSSMINVDPNAMSQLFNFDPSSMKIDTSAFDLSKLDMSSLSSSASGLTLPPLDLAALLGNLNIQISPQALGDVLSQTLADYLSSAFAGGGGQTPTVPPSQTPTASSTPTATDTPPGTTTDSPTDTPTDTPSDTPTDVPTDTPTSTDTTPGLPTGLPTVLPTALPTWVPTGLPSNLPTSLPTNLNVNDVATSFATWFAQPGVQATLMQRLAQVANIGDIQQQLTAALASYMQQAMTQMLTSMMKALGTQLQVAMTATMSKMMSQLSSALSVDPSQIAKLFSFNMDPEQLTTLLMSMMGNRANSMESNLTKLGYADPATPSSINIYPKDFAAKNQVLSILEGYNADMTATGQDDKVITYTDIVGALMTSVTDIISKISAVLVAFVSISLVVSSIMIGVITYISVLERRKEIGILRAMGASKRDIANVFNAETLIIGFVAGVMGVLITVGLTLIANPIISHLYAVKDIARLPVTAAVALIGISMLLTLVAGLMPSSAASRRDPVEALRSE